MSCLWKQVQNDMVRQKTFAKTLDFFVFLVMWIKSEMICLWKHVKDEMVHKKTFARTHDFCVDQVGNVMFVETGSR